MRHFLGVLLLLAQLGPFVGAGLCLHAADHSGSECRMPMPGIPQHDQAPQSGSSPDCVLMAICAPAAPMVPAEVAQMTASPQPVRANFFTPATLIPGDPIAPLLPPPII